MTDRAYTADARSNLVNFGMGSTHNHSFKKARGFRHLPPYVFDRAVCNVDLDITVSFDAGNMVEVDINVFSHYLISGSIA